MTVQRIARQGDILFVRVDSKPAGLNKASDNIIAHGEVTGHAHRVVEAEGVAVLETEDGDKFVEAINDWTISHDEHGSITLEKGIWEARRQREYTPEAIVRVVD